MLNVSKWWVNSGGCYGLMIYFLEDSQKPKANLATTANLANIESLVTIKKLGNARHCNSIETKKKENHAVYQCNLGCSCIRKSKLKEMILLNN